MEKPCVSIWVGNVEDEDSFYAYTRIEFDDDDNYVCVFAKDFQIDQDDIDEDFIEVYWKREKLSPVELLEGCSYYDSLKDEVGKIQDRDKTYNCFVLFYDYEYTGPVCESPSGLSYLGVFEYEK